MGLFGSDADRIWTNDSDGQRFYGYDSDDGKTDWYDSDGKLDSSTDTPFDDEQGMKLYWAFKSDLL